MHIPIRHLIVIFLCVGSLPTYADSVTDCTPALVMSTYNRLDVSHSDWRVASLVTEDEWEKIKHDAGANATIYGIPMGATYSDFKDRVTKKLNSYNESLTQDEKTNVAWTGLDPNSTDTYATCIKGVLSQTGLHMQVTNATKTQVSIRITWSPVGDEHNATPDWTWDDAGKARLPKSLLPGAKTIVLPRPKGQQILAANFRGHETSLIVTPYPPPPTLAKITYTTCVEKQYDSAVADGWGNGWSKPVLFCTPEKPEGWSITRLISFTTTDGGTDRACGGHWGECTGDALDTPTRICRTLTVQGHNDDTHGGHGYLQGHMIVEWRQPLKGDEDPNLNCHRQ